MELVLLAVLSLILGFALGYVLNQRRRQRDLDARAADLSERNARVVALETAHALALKEAEDTRRELERERGTSAHLKAVTASLESTNLHLAQSKAETVSKHDQMVQEKREVEKELIRLREQEPRRNEDYNKKIERLNETHQFVERERAREAALRTQAEVERLERQKETWLRHETDVEQRMRLLCQELGIAYIDKEKFPLGGKPDNAVLICDEYIIFDSKSPQGEDLTNFPAYIRREAEAAKKYAKYETVKKDVFLVVPTNAISQLKNTYLPLGAHRVHVVTIEALHSILSQLKKIEDYEFAEKLSPEDREKIVGILGRMAHGMKRRIQVDHFFANEFISVLTDAENLPPEILKAAQAVERSSKLNPPIEKRAKQIETASLAKEREKLNGKVESQEIHLGPELNSISEIPLHKELE